MGGAVDRQIISEEYLINQKSWQLLLSIKLTLHVVASDLNRAQYQRIS